VAGNRKLYLKLLRQFAEEHGAVMVQVTAALAGGDKALAERLAHTLKGVAGNVGAHGVQSAAGALEKCIRNGAEATAVEAAQRQVAVALDPLLAQLQARLSQPASPEAAGGPPDPADPGRSRELALELLQLLVAADPGAADFAETNRGMLRALFEDERWTQFVALVQGYSFAEAQGQLEQAVQRLQQRS
jgi:two-component system sensor histidine kinase/response regulator